MSFPSQDGIAGGFQHVLSSVFPIHLSQICTHTFAF